MARVIKHEISILAPPSVVWDTTVDVEKWTVWTPTVHSVERLDGGDFRVGSTARIRQPGLPPAVWTVIKMVHEKEFVWETTVSKIHMKATHELKPDGDGTLNTLYLEVSGLMGMLVWPVISLSVPKSLKLENQGLKAHCEKVL